MSGHSKWSNIKHKKEKTDAQKAKIFTKIGREITMAVKSGGGDPTINGKLRDLITKAKQNNVPNDNIDRVIKKAQGGNEADYESITYEGYGPCGTAVIVETLTDNRNRTAGEMRHYFDKFGGNLGTSGSVSWMFAEKGIIVISAEGKDPDAVMMDALEAGAADVTDDSEYIEIFVDPAELSDIKEALSAKGYEFESADAQRVPATYVKIEAEEDKIKFERLMDMLDDNDDVQNVWHNLLEE